MLRADCDRFIEVSKDELKSNYFLQTFETDPCFALPIAKHGIFIDIFPFDNVPDNRFRQIVQDRSSYIYILKRIQLKRTPNKIMTANNNHMSEKIVAFDGVNN